MMVGSNKNFYFRFIESHIAFFWRGMSLLAEVNVAEIVWNTEFLVE
jgi:hypothetical protein